MALSNRLVVYDLENQTIGWTEYNCEFLKHFIKLSVPLLYMVFDDEN